MDLLASDIGDDGDDDGDDNDNNDKRSSKEEIYNGKLPCPLIFKHSTIPPAYLNMTKSSTIARLIPSLKSLRISRQVLITIRDQLV